MPIARAMATMSLMDFEPPEGRRPSVNDPCCGSGRMLLAAAEQNRGFEFSGFDVDLRCVFMTAINLGLRNLRGYVVHANTLTLETFRALQTGFNMAGGVIQEIPIEQCPVPLQHSVKSSVEQGSSPPARDDDCPPPASGPGQQLDLF